jgi:hypothetical protein
MKPTPLLLAISLLLLAPIEAEGGEWWTFENRSYYDPLIAGVREAQTAALVPAFASRMAFMVDERSPRMGWDIDLGIELPIIGWESSKEIGEGDQGVGLWVPIDFHMIEDFVDDSAPIINTDYRFGAMLKYRRGLEDQRWLAARLLIGHESTHLGDEFSIVGRRQFPRSFERINVSWEYADLGVLFESHRGTLPWTARAGVTCNLGDSYYQVGAGTITESPLGPVTLSTNRIDPYAGLEVLREEMFQLRGNVGYDVYASAEVRYRSVYDYHKANPSASEERQLSTNMIVGIKENGGAGPGRVSPFVRYYRGVNPHGQFRNQKDYTEYGIGLRLVR